VTSRRADICAISPKKDPDIVRRLQHNSFITGLDEALAKLAERKRLSYGEAEAARQDGKK
jgi:hypothetical protein